MTVNVRFYGGIKAALPKSARGTHKVHVRTYAELLSYTQQFFDMKSHLDNSALDILVGPKLSEARPLRADQVRWSIPNGSTVHIVPRADGAISTAVLVTALVSAAIAVGVSVLANMLFPPAQSAQEQQDTRKSALYQSGLNTSKAGAVLPYLAGDQVFSGGQVVEGDYTYSGSGDADPYALTGDGLYDGATYTDAWQIGQNFLGGAKGGGSSDGGRTISNTTYTNATIRFAMAYGGGEVGGIVGGTPEEKGKNILINQVPLIDHSTGQANWPGFSWEERFGLAGQAPLKITPGTNSPFSDGTELKQASGLGGGQFYITRQVQAATVDQVKLDFRISTLVGYDSKNNQTATSVSFGADVKRASSGTWQPAGSWTVTEKTSQPIDRLFTIAAPPVVAGQETDPWQFRVYRTTPDSSNDKLQNNTSFQGWIEVTKTDRTYDGSEVVGGVPAALFAAAMDGQSFDIANKPEIALIVMGQKVRVPDNFDPVARTYSGIWSGAWSYKVTANPVWHWLNIATDTAQGCGFPLTFFDKFDLLQTAKRCDEKVNGRFRYSLNKQFTDQTDGWQFLVDLAQTFRAVPHFNGSQVLLTQDRPGTADHFINNSQVEDGKFSYQSTSGGDQFNEAIVQWDDPEDYYRVNQVKYQDEPSITRNRLQNISNNGIVSTTVYKIGCTNRQEAYDYARAIVFDAQHQNNTVSFTTSINACAYAPGQRVLVDDWNLSGKEATGRILEVNAGSIRIDQSVTQKAFTSYDALLVVGNKLSRRALAQSSTLKSTDTFTLDTTDVAADTPVSIVENTGTAPQPTEWRINDIQESEPGKFLVTGVKYVEGKHSWLDNGTPVAETPWTSINPVTPVPTGLAFGQSSYYDDLLGARHGLSVVWDSIKTDSAAGHGIGLAGYQLQVKRPNASTWETAYQGPDCFTMVLNAEPGEYQFTLRSISILGRTSAALTATYTLSYGGGGNIHPPVFLGFK